MGSIGVLEQGASDISFENILNFRDVGKTVNQFLGRKLVREGLLYRSARPDDATPEERRRLRDDLGIRTILDLRTKTEHLNAAKKRQASLAPAPLAQVKSNAAAAEPLQIPGIRYREIRLTGRRFELHLLRQLGWWSILKVLFLFLFGLRMKAIAILGREVMLPRGLVGLGLDTLDKSGPEFLEALESLLDATALPMLVHCTQGKDRTGIVVILVLLLLDVPLKAIEYDYQLSAEALLPEREARLVEIREIGLPDEFGDTAVDFAERVAAHLESAYGGLEGYLDSISFDRVRRQKLREIFAQ